MSLPDTTTDSAKWTEPIPVARWFAAAVGVSALVALFFVIIIPASRDHAQDSNASGFLESLKTAFKQAPREGESKPALAEFETILATNRPTQPAEPVNTHEQSEALLHQFLQWQQKLVFERGHPNSWSRSAPTGS